MSTQQNLTFRTKNKPGNGQMELKMKAKMSKIFVIAIFFLAVAVSGLFGKIDNSEHFKHSQLKRTAQQQGYVKVLVHMDVPQLEVLTAFSTRFQTGPEKSTSKSQPGHRINCQPRHRAQAAFDADIELAHAISNVRNGILHKLDDGQYRINRAFKSIPYMSMWVTVDSLEHLRSLPQVIRIMEDRLIPMPEPTEQESVPQQSPKMVESNLLMGADIAWGYGYDGSGWYVAVLDTGILKSHELFQGKDVQEHCFASGNSAKDRENGHCPNGKPEMHGPGSAMHYPSAYHGSHVAGIAVGNNKSNRFGIARGANLIMIQVFSNINTGFGLSAWESDILYALDYIYSIRNDYPIASINMSLGMQKGYGDFCTEYAMAGVIANLRAVGIAPVISSGNDWYCDEVGAPACVPGAVTVTASNKSDEAANFGNWDDRMVDLVAPGQSIQLRSHLTPVIRN
jgi:subtilisin family serine protease